MSKKNKQKILDVIKECNILRLKPHEALELIQKETGIKISDRTLRRYKKELENSIDARLDYLARTEVTHEHLQAIDFYKKMQREQWKNYYSTKSIKTKNSIIESLMKAQLWLGSYYNNVETLRGMQTWFKSQLGEIDAKKNPPFLLTVKEADALRRNKLTL